ncbi:MULTISPECIES: hypothetical protein [Sanguibacter]|uniref:Integral membrane protein n=1 Tax=Sanguibacter inulinus TaxID=60922 RepID=A0A853EP17_9MICO|nr:MULTISPECIES: hypothetical protein [Sanguibacter]KQU00102.1 hypothetical protein ASG53_04300 [Sanguibacter sp. Leaf3]MBF0721136.1 hypothetical protein [Sanguibacter inulinus]NYS92281.1 hypothetical protein [Sanguibacter inulinus]
MDFLYNLLLVLHLVGWAIVLGGYIATIRQPGVYRGTFHGAATALVTGVLMVGLAESVDSLDKDPSMVKIGIKLVIALVVTVLALVAKKRGDAVAPAVKHTIGGLTLVNVVIAVFV